MAVCELVSARRSITMDEEKLIESVRGFPCLWQVSAKSYKDIKAKENAWKVVCSVTTFLPSFLPLVENG